ncbi:hypothetical protein LCGC14_1570100 [marine sediment metagenome]|uniref:Uncharacterized protein n=1 Tax=marine sediment metagenome TaxID=412755 RepID=A0A0F9IK11_9ZZZZ
MKIIIVLLALGIVLGVLLLAFVGAISLGIIDENFTENVLTISTAKICEVELLNNVLEKICGEKTPEEITVNQDVISIKEDPETGVMKVRNE